MSVDAVEDAVIAHYKTIQLSPERQAKVRAHVLTRIEALERTADKQRDKQQAQIDRIETEQLRLIQAHGAGAVSLKHLVAEQARLKTDMRAAEAALRSTQLKFEDIRTTFGRALDLAGDYHVAYVTATPEVRRMFDQLFFERILVEDGDGTARVSGSTIASPFGAFLTDDLLKTPGKAAAPTLAQTPNDAPDRLLVDLRASWESSEPQTFVLAGQGSKDLVMAERAGFEPAMEFNPHTRLAGECLQPLGHLSWRGLALV